MQKKAGLARVLAVVQLVMGSLGVLNTALGATPDLAQLEQLGVNLTKLEAAFEAYASRMSIIESVRVVPFVVMSVWLLGIAGRLKRFDVDAIAVARKWSLIAFGVLAYSVLVTVVFALPELSKLGDAITSSFGAGAGAQQAKQIVSGGIMATVVGSVIISTAVLAVWPIFLLRWAKHTLTAIEARRSGIAP